MAMSRTASRLGSYSILLVGLFATAYAIGEKLPGHEHSADAAPHAHTGSTGSTSSAELGLSDTVDGTSLIIETSTDSNLVFHIERDGAPVTSFTDAHGALLHLVVVRRDLSHFQHLHPWLAPDGTWTTDVDLAAPGVWRILVDATPATAGGPIVLGTDIVVPGDATDQSIPAPDDSVEIDGLSVQRHGMHFIISPVDNLDTYLGQAAHLIALREGDLAYQHLHPDTDELGSVMFSGALPGPGTYRLFLQFINADQVVTVPFTVVQP
jgi:hypothetical protein